MKLDGYWTVLGTAAPVVILAVVVTLGDTFDTMGKFDQVYHSDDLRRTARSGERALLVAMTSSFINFVLQTSILGEALYFLSKGKNISSLTEVGIEVALGFALLLIGNVLNAVARVAKRELDAATREITPPEAIAATLRSWESANARRLPGTDTMGLD
jgi:hypothetical protein